MRYAFPPLCSRSLDRVFRAGILCALVVLATVADSQSAAAGDWLTLPSTYTHDARGERVHQFAQPGASYAPQVANFRSSGYTHTRSSIQFGPSSDNYHRVEQWGDPVRPYGEWRYPYRPYAQPYAAWGPPLAGLGPMLGGFPGGGYGYGYGYGHGHGHGNGNGNGNGHGGGHEHGPGNGNAGPGNPYPPIPGGGYAVPPYYDGNYPSYPYRPRLNDEEFFSKPVP